MILFLFIVSLASYSQNSTSCLITPIFIFTLLTFVLNTPITLPSECTYYSFSSGSTISFITFFFHLHSLLCSLFSLLSFYMLFLPPFLVLFSKFIYYFNCFLGFFFFTLIVFHPFVFSPLLEI